jgi:hypothetical protein
MNFTLVTPTCDRPETFTLCEKWVARQTVPYHQWIVLDDGINPAPCTMGQTHLRFGEETRGKHSLSRKLKLLMKQADIITGDALAIIEDDDWYRSDYLAVAAKRLQEGFDIIGEGHAIYYNVRTLRWHFHTNEQHASLCQTVIRREAYGDLAKVVEKDDCPFIDVRLWRDSTASRKVFLPEPDKPTLVGIKGIYQGYGIGHSKPLPNYDWDREYFRTLVGKEDAEIYSCYVTKRQNP